MSRVILTHDIHQIIQLIIHFYSHLLYAMDLRDDVGFTVKLEVLPNALCAKELNTFDAEMAHHFVGVMLAVIVLERRRGLSDCAGCGQERAGVGV